VGTDGRFTDFVAEKLGRFRLSPHFRPLIFKDLNPALNLPIQQEFRRQCCLKMNLLSGDGV